MHYEGNIIRPPSEAASVLLQATVGCSHNKCSFCGVYKGERFKIKPDDIIMADIEYASKHFKNQRRLFICDGDALIIPQKRLIPILLEIKKKLPWISRIGMYANTKGLRMKTPNELAELADLGVGILYMGLETGDDVTLNAINKGATQKTMIEMGKKAKESGIKLSITVLLGIAGKERSYIHAEETGKTLSAIDPDFVGALSLMLLPNTPLYDDFETGRFYLLNAMEMLLELREMFYHTHLTRGMFHANHASNYLPIKAVLPKDRERILSLIDSALAGEVNLKPEWMRAL